ncbi:hypothetical protein SAMN05660199_03181 [Klenkia soli]|uniref:GIY-YIG domain-containing protein n=1 Tax=Klenkia soli TaxID=1052260 RepID=A0A1H0Q1C5_9ACTN|nr:hypothetical protein [Klenkia soli]SDP11257.1 hypothetical protein SAMN05660199_03181 [Klenkia soli]
MTFTPFVTEKLDYYVYLLRDPRDGSVFYVGKGVGNRVFAHAADELVAADDSPLSTKLDTIRAIRAEGLVVGTELLRFGLTSKEAFEVEAAAIELLSNKTHSSVALTNLVSGHHVEERGWMTTDAAASTFEAEAAPDISDAVLLIRPSQLWSPKMSGDALFEATHGWWVLNPARAATATYVLSVSRGVIRGVYLPTGWREQRQGDRGWSSAPRKTRWGFEGVQADDDFSRAVLNRDVSRYFARGAQNSVRYLNC